MNPTTIWELDFKALPLRDSRDKRVWELLVCNATGDFKRSRYCSNQEVNSSWVAQQLQEYISETEDPPTAIRVFRSRMSSILQRGCTAAGIPMRPSRRVYTLLDWIDERAREVYPKETEYTYKPEPDPIQELERADPLPLPDKLQGERWALVTLQARDLQVANEWATEFGELIPIDWERLDPGAVIPGLLIASRRASAIAAWMSGIEPAYLQADLSEQSQLILEVGQSDRFTMVRLIDDKTRSEAEGFEARKQAVNGLHFLAIQTRLDAQSFAGFWLLKDVADQVI